MNIQIPNGIQTNRPISELTTFEIGGPARFFAEPSEMTQIRELLAWAKQTHIPVYPLGDGSNILASDSGYNGLLVRLNNQNIDIINKDEEQVLIRVGAGMIWDNLVSFTVQQDWAGIECLSGIPGRVGASPMQNIGAYGQEAAQAIQAVEVLDMDEMRSLVLQNEDCQFAYRSSNFKTIWQGKYLITAVHFHLHIHGPANLRYRDLQNYFRSNSSPTLSEVRLAVLDIRRSKSMLYDRSDPNHRCAGSFFLNPIVPLQEANLLSQQNPDMPLYPVNNQCCKLSAAWLIDHAGFSKGYQQGCAKLSDKHVLCLVNPGGARAQDIISLAQTIKEKVHQKFGVELTAEPNLLGV